MKSIASLPCGRWAKWVVLVVWIALAFGLGPLAGKLTSAQQNDATAWLPKSAESTQVFKLSDAFLPKDDIPTLVVYDRGGAALTAADKAKIENDATEIKKLKYVASIAPTITKDNAAQLIVSINVGDKGWDALGPLIKDIRKISQNGDPGLAAHVTGQGGYGGDFSNVFSGFDSTLLYVTAAIVIIILLVTYRSPILWALPLICVGIALTVAQAVIYLLAKHAGLTVNGQSAFILTVLVFGAGTDYALLLIARYREELRNHEDRHEAMAVALHRAGPAILASGSAVSLAMLCLLLAELNSTKSLGPVMAIGVAVGVAAMLTLLPALLVICGRWLFWPVKPKFGSEQPTERGVWARIGTRIARQPRLTWSVTSAVLILLAIGMFSLDTGGLQNKDAFRSTPDSVTGEKVQAKYFPAGSGSPVQLIGRDSSGAQLQALLSGSPGITDVKSPQTKSGLAYVQGTLNAGPDTKVAYDFIGQLRTKAHAIEGADAKVGGTSAVTLDINNASKHDVRVVVPVVLLMVFVILALLLRALVAPFLLVLTTLLSFGAALGFSALMFQHAFGFAGADPSYPLWVFVFLVALGVDYNIFLMTRVHEETKKNGTRRGALIGLSATGGVITSAGAVLAGTFGALASLPLVFVTEMGFAVAFGVLLDTFVVRSVLVTALNLDLGGRMWWPSKLAEKPDVNLVELAPAEIP
jgi:RND superfamily putative drug exporter